MFWYEDDVKKLEAAGKQNGYKGSTIFYGSSTIRLWDSLAADLPKLDPVNLGFGGSTLAACDWFFNRIMQNYHPERLVIYAGDNDLGDGRHPEEIVIFFRQLVITVKQRFGGIPCYFISAKPSISRWNIVGQFKYTNELIAKEIKGGPANWQFIDVFTAMLDNGKLKNGLFVDDGLHLSKLGYNLWKNIIAAKVIIDN